MRTDCASPVATPSAGGGLVRTWAHVPLGLFLLLVVGRLIPLPAIACLAALFSGLQVSMARAAQWSAAACLAGSAAVWAWAVIEADAARRGEGYWRRAQRPARPAPRQPDRQPVPTVSLCPHGGDRRPHPPPPYRGLGALDFLFPWAMRCV